jgi:hypothetical protein
LKDATEEEKVDGSWIPAPGPEWPGLTNAVTIQKILAMGYTGMFHQFFVFLFLGNSSYYAVGTKKIYPLLLTPINDDQRGKIAFYLLLHNGYLTRSEGEVDHFKIPNNEIKEEFTGMITEYLRQISKKIETSKLLRATKSENFQELGEEITNSLHTLYIDRKEGKNNPDESVIHDMIFAYLHELQKSEDGYQVIREHGGGQRRTSPDKSNETESDVNKSDEKKPNEKKSNEKKSDLDASSTKTSNDSILGNRGYRIDIHLRPKSGDSKTDYVIELKSHIKDDERIFDKALVGLLQIFQNDYLRDIKTSKETKAIVTMGIAAHFDKICMVTLKVNVVKGLIHEANTIEVRKFEITGNDAKGENMVECTYQDKVEIKLILEDYLNQNEIETEIEEEVEVRLYESYRIAIVKAIQDTIIKTKDKRKDKRKKKTLMETILRILKT